MSLLTAFVGALSFTLGARYLRTLTLTHPDWAGTHALLGPRAQLFLIDATSALLMFGVLRAEATSASAAVAFATLLIAAQTDLLTSFVDGAFLRAGLLLALVAAVGAHDLSERFPAVLALWVVSTAALRWRAALLRWRWALLLGTLGLACGAVSVAMLTAPEFGESPVPLLILTAFTSSGAIVAGIRAQKAGPTVEDPLAPIFSAGDVWLFSAFAASVGLHRFALAGILLIGLSLALLVGLRIGGRASSVPQGPLLALAAGAALILG